MKKIAHPGCNLSAPLPNHMAEPRSTPMPAAAPPPSPPADDPLFGNPVSALLLGALDAEPGAGAGESPQGTAQAEWAPPAVEHLAALLPSFGVQGMIGRGGMGAVYQGMQLSLNRPVAIKLLPAELAASAEFVNRFQREAQTLARLQHPGIVAVHDFGRTAEGHLYFIMEFVAGTDLQRIIHSPGLQPEQALELTLQICEALQYAHSQGVIHRDIKPANVLITQDGRAKLADFGLARPLTTTPGMTAASLVMGTPEYMAPEQWAGKVDHRADIYALGVMLYEMLTGTRPHGAFDLPSTKSSVDVRLDDVVIKAMRQSPDQRYQNVSELRDAVHHIRTQVSPGAAAPQTTPHPVRRAQGASNPRGSMSDTIGWAAAVVVLLALAGTGMWLLQGAKSAASKTSVAAVVPDSLEEKQAPAGSKPPLSRMPAEESKTPVPAMEPVKQTTPGTASATLPPPMLPPPTSSIVAPTYAPVPAGAAAPATIPPSATASSSPAVIEVFTREAQNLISWAVAPLEASIPEDVSRNLTFIREDLIDEGKAKPAASLDAYREAYYLCEELQTALDSRRQAQAAFGYRSAQAAANQPMSNQALDARRNYLMSWPQYSREESQRDALRGQNSANTAVVSEASKVAWGMQTKRTLSTLDARYRAFRAALRK